MMLVQPVDRVRLRDELRLCLITQAIAALWPRCLTFELDTLDAHQTAAVVATHAAAAGMWNLRAYFGADTKEGKRK